MTATLQSNSNPHHHASTSLRQSLVEDTSKSVEEQQPLNANQYMLQRRRQLLKEADFQSLKSRLPLTPPLIFRVLLKQHNYEHLRSTKSEHNNNNRSLTKSCNAQSIQAPFTLPVTVFQYLSCASWTRYRATSFNSLSITRSHVFQLTTLLICVDTCRS